MYPKKIMSSKGIDSKKERKKGETWEGGGATEKPRSAAIERASDIPPMRLNGFFPTQVVSLPIDISSNLKHSLVSAYTNFK